MGFCGGVRRTINKHSEAKVEEPPRRAPDSMEESHVFVVTQEVAKQHGWGGAGGVRWDFDNTLFNDNEWVAFKLHDTWPARFLEHGARFFTRDVLDVAEGLKAGGGQVMADIIVHELMHECGFGHDYDNVIMNADLRGGVQGGMPAARYEEIRRKDYAHCKNIVLAKLPALYVDLENYPPQR